MLIEKQKRAFLGKVTGFDNKDERRRSQKALKAYLSGKRYFRDGYITMPYACGKIPNWIKTPIQDRILVESK